MSSIWKTIIKGQDISLNEEKTIFELLKDQHNRKQFIFSYIKDKIKAGSIPPDDVEKTRDTTLKILYRFLNEVFDWKLFNSSAGEQKIGQL